MRELWAELDSIYGNMSPTPAELTGMDAPGAAFIIARDFGRPIACAALRPRTSEIAELKRMYVQPGHRRNGIGRRMLRMIEDLARERGFREIWLETGIPQAAAVRLYESRGYVKTAKFGDYKDESDCLCYAKKLIAPDAQP